MMSSMRVHGVPLFLLLPAALVAACSPGGASQERGSAVSQQPPQSGAPAPPAGSLDTSQAVHGIITFQKGYGVGSQGEWSQLLRSLAGS